MHHSKEKMHLESCFEISPFEVYVVDIHTYQIVHVNAKMRQHLGYLLDDSLPCHQALFQNPTPCEPCNINRLPRTCEPLKQMHHLSERYDEYRQRWLQLHEKIVPWSDGRLVKYAIAVDVTEIKNAQNSLAEAHARMALMNKDLQRQNHILQENIRLREDVERMTKHDLKTPLTPIIHFPKMIIEQCPGLPEPAIKMLSAISNAGGTMLNMINSTLDLFKLEQRTYVLQPEPCNIFALLNTAMDHLQPLAKPRDVVFAIHVDGSSLATTDVITVLAENLLCYSMLSNLMKNAVEAAPCGSKVDVRVQQEGDMVCVQIENQGETPKEVRDHFFEKYATARKGGTGLGTYSAKLIVEVHGGSVTLDASRPGYTSILVRLPAAGSSIAPVESASRNERSFLAKNAVDTAQHLEKINILLVDDSPTLQLMALSYLQRTGISVDVAENGAEAVEAFRNNSYDLILMDIELPVMNGFMATREIRRLESESWRMKAECGKSSLDSFTMNQRKGIPVIAMTAHDDQESRETCLKAGLDDFIAKPLRGDDLLALVEKWTRLKSGIDSSQADPEQNTNLAQRRSS